MKINLYTDAAKHNHALMMISAYHKAQGDETFLNMPILSCDLSYASILFEWNKNKFHADFYGGPAFGRVYYPFEGINKVTPDYELFGLNYSLGYTFRGCRRNCDFCKVPRIEDDYTHQSIWDFHDSRFPKICLLNNNTFFDPQWKETFEEIWDAGLSVIDENGYDLRLMNDEKADAMHCTKWATPIHFAWDRMEDEPLIRKGLALLAKYHLRSTSNGVYVLIGYDSTVEEDIHRCQVIDDFGLTPYPMPYDRWNKRLMQFKRFINLHYYRGYRNIAFAWQAYQRRY